MAWPFVKFLAFSNSRSSFHDVMVAGFIVLLLLGASNSALKHTENDSCSNYAFQDDLASSDENSPSAQMKIIRPSCTFTHQSGQAESPTFSSGVLENNSVINGDHIVINCTVDTTPIGSTVLQTGIHLEEWGLLKEYESTQNLMIPSPDYNPFSGPIDPSQFSWVTLKGLKNGNSITIIADYTNSDCDFFAWPGSIDPSTYYYANQILPSHMAEPRPYFNRLTWQWENDTMLLACFDFDLQPGTWTILFEQEITSDSEVNGAPWIAYDTYSFCRNITLNIVFNVTLDLGLTYTYHFENITFNNFFAPKVHLLSPNGGEDWSNGMHNITWTAIDPNVHDEIWFRIRLSLDRGRFWWLLASDWMEYDPDNSWYYYEFDFSNPFQSDEGVIQIIAYDNDTRHAGGQHPLKEEELLPSFWPHLEAADTSDGVFSLGVYEWIEPTLPEVEVDSPENIVLEEGDTGRFVTWSIYYELSIWISVSRNGILISSEVVYGSGYCFTSASLNNLAVGLYNFTLYVEPYFHAGRQSWSDTVLVEVNPRQSSTTSFQLGVGLEVIVFSTTIGCLCGGAVVLVFALARQKRRR
ncbi:MAG: hypothetical protein EAX95_14750 [Candidatus Thorarchaeota archaeon]|nr:hypothetical protein [Candidatus Thorarchaeota archaeon]